jgi:hypothetical protein
MAQVKGTFYLPVEDNDGRALRGEIEAVRRELFDLFVGWTFLGYVKGAFLMTEGAMAIDESEAYMVILDEERVYQLERVLAEFKMKTLQEAIYLEINRDVDVRFI